MHETQKEIEKIVRKAQSSATHGSRRKGETEMSGRRQVKNMGWTKMASVQSASVYNGDGGDGALAGPGSEPWVSGLGDEAPEAENLSAFGCPTEVANFPCFFSKYLSKAPKVAALL